MNKKRTIITGFVLILIILSAYLVLNKSKSETSKNLEKEVVIKWEDKIPEIKTVVKQGFPDGETEGLREVGVFKEGDVTGDGIPEALVYTGGGGAYTDQITLVIIEDGKPALARFKQKNGETAPLVFLSGASVRNGEMVEIASGDNIVYSVTWSMSDVGKMEACDVNVYQWNENTKVFEFDSVLSDGSKSKLCNPLI